MNYRKEHQRKVLKNFSWLSFFLFIAMVIVGFRILYPYHFVVAIPFLVLAVRFALVIFITEKNKVVQTPAYAKLKKKLARFEKLFFILLFLGVGWYIVSQTLPSDKNPYEDMSNEEVIEFVDQSLSVSILYVDQLEILGNAFVQSGLLDKTELTADELSKLQSMWNEFLLAAQGSEEITDITSLFWTNFIFRFS